MMACVEVDVCEGIQALRPWCLSACQHVPGGKLTRRCQHMQNSDSVVV